MSRVVPLRRPSHRPRPVRRAPTSAPLMGVRKRRREGAGILHRILRCIVSGWFVGKFLAIGVLAVGVWGFVEAADAPELRVAAILVAGNALVPAEEIAESLPLTDVNVFMVRGSRLAQIVQQDPAIAAARIEPRLPNSVYVSVRERRPAVVWESPSGSTLADESGLVIRDGARPLPTVSAPDGPAPRPGERVDALAVQVAESVGPRVDELGLPGGHVEFRPSSGVALVAPGAARVVLGFGDEVEMKLSAYEAIRRYLDQSRQSAELIDVRFLDRPFFR